MNDYKPLDLTIIGAGMIVHDLILPAAYQLQRQGYVKNIAVCGTRVSSLQALKDNTLIKEAFPGQEFTPFPALDSPAGDNQELYKEALAKMAPYQAVIVALPDQLHYEVMMNVLDFDQHVLCVKPLVLKHKHGVEIAQKAKARGLYVGVEYHKRFDRRSLIARKNYLNGDLGKFVIGEAKLIEPYYYRYSNFQNWFTTEFTDPFVYVGCHYVDLVYFITGLKPVEVSVSGVKGKFPNGNEAFMWANGRVRFENGALLSVTDGLGYPDDGAGSNEQGLSMFFEGNEKGAIFKHNDQFRGAEYSFIKGRGPANKLFHYINPDFFQLVPWEGEGYKPIGYGPDSVMANIKCICQIEARADKDLQNAHSVRLEAGDEADRKGLLATPENSYINELVHEAARLSILNDGVMALIEYEPEPQVRLKHA
ncbi:MAG: Gfo/Idh/MocA family oxidoreductase [Desulfobacterales bacterium]|nr:MAG: Gfo/Idh/MocA family oxidoreductase [Desulfobacterales bacterium]